MEYRFGVWSLVKVIAELTILSRASFAMLILVPILAGVWTTISEILPERNFAVAPLSSLWVFLYFASLFYVFAQLLYQSMAPETIKNYTARSLAMERIDDYLKSPNAAQLCRMARYVHISNEDQLTLLDIVGEATYSKEFVRSGAEQNRVITVKHAESMQKTGKFKIKDHQALIGNVVGGYSRSMYYKENSKKWAISLISFALFFSSICLILTVIYFQSIAVLQSAEWI